MNNKNLAILAIIAVVMVLLAVSLSNRVNKPSGQNTEADLIQGLDPAAIGTIVLRAADQTATIKRSDHGFVILEKDGYPAKISTINELLGNCLKIRTTGLFTANPDNFADLEVTEDKARTVVKFLKNEPNDPILTGLIIGKALEKGEGNYVRLLSADENASNNVYIATDVPWISAGPLEYVDRDITSFERKDIASVTVTDSNSVIYTLQRPDPNSETLVLSSMPEGKTLKTSDAESTFNALTGLRFDDVSKDDGGITFDRAYTCRLKNQIVYAVRLATKDEKTYAAFNATYTGQVPQTVSKTETDEQLKEKEAKLLARDEAARFVREHGGWVYEIPSYKAKYITRGLNELLEDEKTAADVISDEELASPAELKVTTEPNTPAVEPAPVPEPNQPVVEPNEPAPAEPNQVADPNTTS